MASLARASGYANNASSSRSRSSTASSSAIASRPHQRASAPAVPVLPPTPPAAPYRVNGTPVLPSVLGINPTARRRHSTLRRYKNPPMLSIPAGCSDRIHGPQWDVLRHTIEARENVFFTGPFNSGKTDVLVQIINTFRFNEVRFTVCSTSPSRAAFLDGTTLDAYCGIGQGTRTAYSIIQDAARDTSDISLEALRADDVLILDRIDALTPEMFCLLDQLARQARGRPEFMGGLQLVATGDFSLLPSRLQTNIGRETGESDFFRWTFDPSTDWNSRFDIQINLPFRERHSADPVFDNVVNEIRTAGRANTIDNRQTWTSLFRTKFTDADRKVAVHLFRDPQQAMAYNYTSLQSLPGPEHIFTAAETWDAEIPNILVAETFSSSIPVEQSLTLKQGSLVMIHHNEPSIFRGFSNRAIGHVIAFLSLNQYNRLHRDRIYEVCTPAHNAYRDAADLRCEFIHHPSDYCKVYHKYSKGEWPVVELYSPLYKTRTVLFLAVPQTYNADCIPYLETLSAQGRKDRVAKLVKNELPVLPPMVTRNQVPLTACHAMSIHASKDYEFLKIVVHLDHLDNPLPHLLYTAISRIGARQDVLLVNPQDKPNAFYGSWLGFVQEDQLHDIWHRFLGRLQEMPEATRKAYQARFQAPAGIPNINLAPIAGMTDEFEGAIVYHMAPDPLPKVKRRPLGSKRHLSRGPSSPADTPRKPPALRHAVDIPRLSQQLEDILSLPDPASEAAASDIEPFDWDLDTAPVTQASPISEIEPHTPTF